MLTYLKKIDKDLQVDIFTLKFQELVNRHFIKIQRESQQESLFILKRMADFIEGAKVHPGVGNKHPCTKNEVFHYGFLQ